VDWLLVIVKTIDSIGLRRYPGFSAENRLQSTSTEFNCFSYFPQPVIGLAFRAATFLESLEIVFM